MRPVAIVLGVERTDDGRVAVRFDLGTTRIGTVIVPADVWHTEGADAAIDAAVAKMEARMALLRGGRQ